MMEILLFIKKFCTILFFIFVPDLLFIILFSDYCNNLYDQSSDFIKKLIKKMYVFLINIIKKTYNYIIYFSKKIFWIIFWIITYFFNL